MLVGSILGAVIGLAISTVVAGLLIWLVGSFGVGIEVDGPRPAFLAGLFIALMWLFAAWLWNVLGYDPGGGIAGAITHLILTAAFLFAVRNKVTGLEVKGFMGALIGATAIALVTWLASLALAAVLPA